MPKFLKLFSLIALLAIALNGACAPKAPTEPPVVLSFSPAEGEEVKVDTPITITFSQPMDKESVEKALTITPQVKGTISWSKNTLVFRPEGGWARDTLYRVRLGVEAKSSAGLFLSRPLEFSFSSAGYLEVSAVQPAPGSTSVGVERSISVVFNRPIVPLTAIEEQKDLPQPLEIEPAVKGKGYWLNTSVFIFKPDPALAPATTYTVTVKAGLKDTSGNALEKDYSWSFTTEPFYAKDFSPKGFEVPLTSPITVTFNAPASRQSVEKNFSLEEADKRQKVPGSFRWEDDYTVVFTPAQKLKVGTKYQVRIEKEASSASGGNLISPIQWSFQTVPYPAISYTYPHAGAKDADLWGINIHFNAPIDPKTLADKFIVTPTLTNVYTWWNEFDHVFYLSAQLEPSTLYTVTVKQGIADPYGNVIREDYVFTFTTKALDPAVYLATLGDVLYDARQVEELFARVFYVNVSRLDFRLYRLSEEEFVNRSFLPKRSSLINSWSQEVSPPLNKTEVLTIPLRMKDGSPLAPGLYLLSARAPELEKLGYEAKQYFAVVNTGLVLKYYPSGALVWATDFRTAKPLPGVRIKLMTSEKVLAEGVTDREGIALLEFSGKGFDPWSQLVAFAYGEGIFGVVSNSWNAGLSPWDFGLSVLMEPKRYAGFIYTDRPIYRPGQVVHYKGIFRLDNDASYQLPPLGEKVLVNIYDAEGKLISKEEKAIGPYGTISGDLTLGDEASLGYYRIEAAIGEERTEGFFQVAEYRKPEFEVSLKTDKDSYIQGEKIAVTVSAIYYFGQPVKEAKVYWSVMSRDYFFHHPDYPYYEFTDYEWGEEWKGPYGESIASGEGKTDSQGLFSFTIPADISTKKLSQYFTIDVRVVDVDGREVASQAFATVHKGEFYIGLAPRSWVGKVGEKQQVDLAMVKTPGRDGFPTSVTVVVSKHRWYSVQEEQEDGTFRWVTKVEDTPILTTTVKLDEKGRGVVEFTPDEGGTYKVSASARDRLGNEIRSATYLWISSHEYVSWPRAKELKVDLIPDKKEYRPGDTARILIPSPYPKPVNALLTVERGRIMEHKVLTVAPGGFTVEVPLTERHVPNVYVSVILLRGEAGDETIEPYRTGYIKLPVSPESKLLQVQITPDREKAGPGEEVSFEVKVTDSQGKGVKTELSLALVDKALLALAERPSSLVQTFWQERPLSVNTSASLAVSAERFALARGKGGGGGLEEFAPIRREFLDTAYWVASLETDAQGYARITVKLPDNLTTWRMDAKGVTTSELMGEGQKDLVVSKDLLIRPTLPRFFTVGDEAEIGAVVHNNTSQPLEVKVSLEAKGLEIQGDPSLALSIPAYDKAPVRWKVKVPGVEKAVVTMRASGSQFSDAVEITLPVHHYSTPEVVSTAGVLEEDGERVELIRLPQVMDPALSKLVVKLEPSLAAAMQGGLTYLEHYPYECIEQIVSKFLPNVFTYRALRELGIEDEDLKAKVAQMVGVGLQKIYARQNYDGGWGWWGPDKSSLNLTSYVLLGLVEARDAGFAVDQKVMKRAALFIKENLSLVEGPESRKADIQAFALYVLARYGEGDVSRCMALYRERKNSGLGHYGKAFLAMALQILAPSETQPIDTLLDEILGEAVLDATGAHWEEAPDYWAMNTNTRSTSIILSAFARIKPSHPLLPNVVRWLMAAREEDRWSSTYETAWAIMGLTDYMKATGELKASYRYLLALNEQEIASGTITPEMVRGAIESEIPAAQLKTDRLNRLTIVRKAPEGQDKGTGRLYYAAYLRYFVPVEKIEELQRGVIIQRRYTDPACKEEVCPSIDKAEVGQLIKVNLTIIAPRYLLYLVVEDPIPAGAEIVDTSLKTVSVTYEQEGELRKKSEPVWWWYPTHADKRDEKLVLFATYLSPGTYEYSYLIKAGLPGEFKVLPAVAYEMYFPHIFGRTGGMSFKIK